MIILIDLYLTYITIISIESYRQKYKDSPFDKFLSKFEKACFKNSTILKGIISYISIMLIIFILFIFFLIIKYPFKQYVFHVLFNITIIYSFVLGINFAIFLGNSITLKIKGKRN